MLGKMMGKNFDILLKNGGKYVKCLILFFS